MAQFMLIVRLELLIPNHLSTLIQNCVFYRIFFLFAAEFRTFDFCPNAAQVVYVAEKKVPKSEAFYKRKAPKDSGDGDEKKADENKIKSVRFHLHFR